MPYCSSCSRLVSISDEEEPEVSDVEVDDDGKVTATVRIHNDCAECGQELKAAEFDVEIQLDIDHEHENPDGDGMPSGPEWDPTLNVARTVREHPPRAKRRKKYYGISAVATATCSCGWTTDEVTDTDEVQAGGMDDA